MRASFQLFSQQLLCEGIRFLTDCVTRMISTLNIKIASGEINHVALQGDGHLMLQLPSDGTFRNPQFHTKQLCGSSVIIRLDKGVASNCCRSSLVIVTFRAAARCSANAIIFNFNGGLSVLCHKQCCGMSCILVIVIKVVSGIVVYCGMALNDNHSAS